MAFGSAAALEIGFEGLLSLEASDNVAGVNSPDEEDGFIAGAQLGIYGEQRSRLVSAAFSGEIDTRQTNTDDDSDVNTVSRFLGAAEFYLTPRSWRWYVGDILGGVRTDNAVQPIDDNDIDRRNVFVTGPSFEYDVEGVSRTRARLLYINQTEDNESLETLYNASFSYERDTTTGSYFGFRLSDIYTDLPELANDTIDQSDEPDFNRLSSSVYWNRLRGFLELYGEIGLTRYDADEESLNGLNAQLRATRTLGPQTSLSIALTRDLSDQALSTIESLISSGGEAAGVRPEASGIFAETRLGIEYSFQSARTSLDLGTGVAQLDYKLLSIDSDLAIDASSEDQLQGFAYVSYSRRLATRLRGELSANYERREFDNRNDESDSVLASAQLIYQLSRSFELEGGLVHDTATGLRTRFNTGVGVEEDIDVTENRITVGIRWAPPSRANQDLTIELKSLLQ
ncbi:MAG: hypothetical protein AB8B79_13680 [Granulosicoccus sp.]